MLTRITAALLAASLLASCASTTPEQNRLLVQARSIGSPPFKRSALVKGLGLEGLKSQQIVGGIRSGQISVSETWDHPSGLTIDAYDWEYVGSVEITAEFIDGILEQPGRKLGDFVGNPAIDRPRKSFESLVISKRGKVLYSSTGKRD